MNSIIEKTIEKLQKIQREYEEFSIAKWRLLDALHNGIDKKLWPSGKYYVDVIIDIINKYKESL